MSDIEVGDAVEKPPSWRGKFLSRLTNETAVLWLVVALGLLVGVRDLADNSALVHLRTGIEMWKSHSIPRHDIYSFSAPGTPWTVQSWLASGIYGAINAAFGLKVVSLFNSALVCLTTLILAMQARTGRLASSLFISLTVLAIGTTMFAPRPLLFGLLCFALVSHIVFSRRNPLWLLPVMWVWVNSHGSFPVGIAWVGSVLIGVCVDAKLAGEFKSRVSFKSVEFKRLTTLLLVSIMGALVGAINPLGFRLLTFWTNALSRGEVFKAIREWASPDFHSASGVLLLVTIVFAVCTLVGGVVRWKTALGALMLVVATLWSVRYAPMLAVAFVPAMRDAVLGFRARRESNRTVASAAGVGNATDAVDASPVFRIACVVLSVIVVSAVVGRTLTRPAMNFSTFPVASIAKLTDHQRERLGTSDYVGCYRVWAEGRNAHVFIDDRYDMYPTDVAMAQISLKRGVGNTADILDRFAFTAIIWEKNSALYNYLLRDPKWKLINVDKTWATFVPA